MGVVSVFNTVMLPEFVVMSVMLMRGKIVVGRKMVACVDFGVQLVQVSVLLFIVTLILHVH